MGLDVCVHEYLTIPDDVKTQDELDKFCNEHNGGWEFYSEHHKNFPKKYVRKIPVELIDWDATFKKRGLNCEDYATTILNCVLLSPAIPLLGIYPQEVFVSVREEAFAKMFTGTLSINW